VAKHDRTLDETTLVPPQHRDPPGYYYRSPHVEHAARQQALGPVPFRSAANSPVSGAC